MQNYVQPYTSLYVYYVYIHVHAHTAHEHRQRQRKTLETSKDTHTHIDRQTASSRANTHTSTSMNTSVHPYRTCRRKDGQTYIPTVAWSIKSWVDITTRHFIRSCVGSGSFGNPSKVACVLLFDKRGHPILHSKYHSVIWCFVFRWLVHFESNRI